MIVHSNKKIKNLSFTKFIIPYVCVLIVPMLVWFVSNLYVNHKTEEKLMLFSKSTIKNNIAVVDSKLSLVENVVYGISQNNSFKGFFKNEKITYKEKLQCQKIFSSYDSQLGGIGKLYMYSNASDLVITTTGEYANPEEYFEYSSPLVGYSAEKWANEVRTGTWASGYTYQQIRNNTQLGYEEVVSYVRNIPIEYITKKDGIIGLYINKNNLLQGFDNLLEESRGELYVFNPQGDLIMSTGGKFQDYTTTGLNGEFTKLSLDGEDYYRISCKGGNNQWQYVVFIDGNYIFKDISRINTVLNIVNILTLILGLLLCVYFTYGRNKSYLQVVRILGIEDEFNSSLLNFNEYELWKPYLSDLLAENKKIKEDVKELSETRRYKALHMLLSEFNGNDDEAYALAHSSGLDFQYGKFLVLVLETSTIYTAEGINNKNIFLKQVLEKFISEDLYLYIQNSKNTVFIVNYDIDTEEMYLLLKEKIAKINLEVFYRFNYDVICGVSEECTNMSKLCNSRQEAMDVIKYKKLIDSNEILFFRDLPEEKTMFDYPVELKNRFIQTVSGGNVEETLKIIDEIYENNFKSRTLSAKRTEELFKEINATLNEIKNRVFNDDYSVVYNEDHFTVKKFFEYVKEFSSSLCESCKIFNDRTYESTFKDMTDYINKNYFRSDLSLTSLAETFKFTNTSYVSRLFKNFVNENFSLYLEKIRIEKACEILLCGEQVKNVAEKVGYISDVTFRRAFKKRVGISPSEFVKKHRDTK